MHIIVLVTVFGVSFTAIGGGCFLFLRAKAEQWKVKSSPDLFVGWLRASSLALFMCCVGIVLSIIAIIGWLCIATQ